MITKELKQKWVQALRSGKYKQGMGNLRNTNNEYCCLGVLCDIVNHDEWIETRLDTYSFRDNCQYLPASLQVGVCYECKLINMNDKGQDFNIIADYIESHIIPEEDIKESS